jgi:antitoxin YefM
MQLEMNRGARPSARVPQARAWNAFASGVQSAAHRARERLRAATVSSPLYRFVYTSPVAKTVPVRELRNNLGKLLSDVADRRDHVLITRNGRPAAALVPIDEYDALEETAEVLSDPDALAALEAGLSELERSEAITLDELRRELAQRRAQR